MRNHNPFISGDHIGAVRPFDLGAVDTAALLLAAQVKAREEVVDRVQTEKVHQEGYAEGFAQGYAQANVNAQRQMAEFVETHRGEVARDFAGVFSAAQAQLMQAEQTLAQGVLELACEIARHVIRRELASNPNALQPVIREALGLLAADSRRTVVRLNPLDAEVLQDAIQAEFSPMALVLRADATVTRGGCLMESAGTVVDATVEKRWLRAVRNLGQSIAWEDADEQ